MSGDAKSIAALASRGWMSLSQLTTILGVSYPTILKMRDRNEILAIKVGGVYRVYMDEVQRLLEKGNHVE